MATEKVLIVGSGVSGSIMAYWLAKANYEVMVIERSKASQKLGQGIEIEEPALAVVRAMNLLDELKQRRTGEAGTVFEDENSRIVANLAVGAASPTGELELMRGELTEALYLAADKFPNVTYRFETTVQSIRQTPQKVTVDMEDRNTKQVTTEEFEMVVGADGARSRTRQLIMGPPDKIKCYHSTGVCGAYFSIPNMPGDWPNSRICNFPGRRTVWIRPVGEKSELTSVYLIHSKTDNVALREANASGDRQRQKEVWRKIYSGLGWEVPRVIEEMMHTNNFYSDEFVQVKLDRWSEGRVVLVGDAAWAPTPITGEGNQCAIKGSWVLAQEMTRNRSPLAFKKFEERFRPHVEDCQNVPLGGNAQYLFNPETAWGIWILRNFMWLLALLMRLFVWSRLESVLPEKEPDHNFNLEMDEHETKKTK